MTVIPMNELKPDNVTRAARRLHGIVNKTPMLTSRTLNERIGAQLFLKAENFQRVGAFKFRGAYHAVSQLSPAARAAGVITHSSGNHAQGLALAASLLGVRATIVMPENAPPIKKAATAGYGAHIINCPAVDREKVCAAEIAAHGYTLIHPYDNADIIAGQGTAAYELLQSAAPLDYIFAPVGGGGLLSGTALAAAALYPACKVIGVEPAGADDACRSWRDGRIHRLEQVPPTAADGLRTRFVGERNLAVMTRYVADMITIQEDEIFSTLQFLWQRMKLLVEPSAAVALAPLLHGRFHPPSTARIGVILSGGNVDIPQLLNDYASYFTTE